MKRALGRIMNRTGLLGLCSHIREQARGPRVAIVAYHRVGPSHYSWSLESIECERFRLHLEYFSRSFDIVPLAVLVQAVRSGTSFSSDTLALTFDDGYRDFYEYAYPMLKEFGVPATVFLGTGSIGTGRLYWWDKVGYIVHNTGTARLDLAWAGFDTLDDTSNPSQVTSRLLDQLKMMPEQRKERIISQLNMDSDLDIPMSLASELYLSWKELEDISREYPSIEFGGHTVTQPILMNISLREVEWEVRESKQEIEKRLGKQCRLFSYPNGDYNDHIARIVEQCGYDGAVTGRPQELIGLGANPFGLTRIGATASDEIGDLEAKLTGLWGDFEGCSRKVLSFLGKPLPLGGWHDC